MSYQTERRVLLGIAAVVFVGLGIDPVADRMIWFLENLPALLGLAALLATDRWFKFSRLAYRLMALHAIILIVGGHWTYAEVPLGDWVRDAFDLSRNHYDRVGHFAQGFVPAIVIREVLIRTTPVPPGGWLFFIVCSICLAISAFYELIEWWVALITGEAAAAFLGTQGDVWDTQWDMALALIGSILSQLLFASLHDRGIREVSRRGAEAQRGRGEGKE